MIRYVGPGQRELEALLVLRIARQMATNAEEERRDTRDTLLLPHHQEKGQHIFYYLINIA
ncbi:MAG: hypothetical protein WAU53_07475 [Rhodoplanes sp.]